KLLSCDPPAADDQVVLIKHSGLAGRDGSLRRMQFYFHGTIAGRRHCCRGARMVIADLSRHLDCAWEIVVGRSVAICGVEYIAVEPGSTADHDEVVPGIQFQ